MYYTRAGTSQNWAVELLQSLNLICLVPNRIIGNNQHYLIRRDGEVTFEKELSFSSSYFQMRNLGTLVTQLHLPL